MQNENTKHRIFGRLNCIILSLHNLAGVMDDEDDRRLLDILG